MEHPWQVLTVLIIQLGFKTIKVFPCISHRFPEIWKDRKRPSSSASKKRHLKQNRLPSLFAFKKLNCWTPQSFPIVCRHWHVLGTSSESTVIWSLWPINIHPMFPRISSPRFSHNKALLTKLWFIDFYRDFTLKSRHRCHSECRKSVGQHRNLSRPKIKGASSRIEMNWIESMCKDMHWMKSVHNLFCRLNVQIIHHELSGIKWVNLSQLYVLLVLHYQATISAANASPLINEKHPQWHFEV